MSYNLRLCLSVYERQSSRTSHPHRIELVKRASRVALPTVLNRLTHGHVNNIPYDVRVAEGRGAVTEL